METAVMCVEETARGFILCFIALLDWAHFFFFFFYTNPDPNKTPEKRESESPKVNKY